MNELSRWLYAAPPDSMNAHASRRTAPVGRSVSVSSNAIGLFRS
jgi:hypothetical protein